MKDLFLFTIGPVKELIDNSRKAMDLYAGSRFLSELMGEAIHWLEVKKIKILIPVITKGEKEGPVNIPNRLVAEFSNDCSQQKCEIAEELTSYIKHRFCQICLKLLEEAGIPEDGKKMAQVQFKDFLEVYWIFEPFGSLDYSEVYQKIFTSIQEVKGIRPLTQAQEPYGRKCLLFPQYNAIFAKKYDGKSKQVYPYMTNPNYVCDISANDYLRYTVKPKEALSSIALIKRIYGQKLTEFYSLRYMLLKSRFSEIDHEIQEEGRHGKEQKDMIANAIYDIDHGQVLQEEEYTPQVIRQASDIYQKIKRNNKKLSSYYAVIKFDGDNIGDAFRERKTAEEQQDLSRKISDFARKVPELLGQHYGGLPVYAGGEDFLGFIPLDHLFECVDCLYHYFSHFSNELSLSFSAGIVIAHLMQPLKEVMIFADEMEESAKRMPDKKAVAVGIMKRSGNRVVMPPCKLRDEERIPQWKDLSELVQILKSTQCSRSLFFNMARLMRRYWQGGEKPENQLAEVLLRDCILHSTGEKNQSDKENLAARLMLFYKNFNYTEEFLQTLDGITFLAREMME